MQQCPAGFNAWLAWRLLVDLVLAMDLASYILLCVVFADWPWQIQVDGLVLLSYLVFLPYLQPVPFTSLHSNSHVLFFFRPGRLSSVSACGLKWTPTVSSRTMPGVRPHVFLHTRTGALRSLTTLSLSLFACHTCRLGRLLLHDGALPHLQPRVLHLPASHVHAGVRQAATSGVPVRIPMHRLTRSIRHIAGTCSCTALR